MTKASTTTPKTEFGDLTLDELRALERRLSAQAKTTRVPEGISREEAHRRFDESREAAIADNEALDEIVSKLARAQPGAPIKFPPGSSTLYALSDEFAAAVHARIDATPLYVGWGSIAWETEADRQAARDEVFNARGQADSTARRVQAEIKRREEEEIRQALEDELQQTRARQEERRQRANEEARQAMGKAGLLLGEAAASYEAEHGSPIGKDMNENNIAGQASRPSNCEASGSGRSSRKRIPILSSPNSRPVGPRSAGSVVRRTVLAPMRSADANGLTLERYAELKRGTN
jgi:hypothetical protein